MGKCFSRLRVTEENEARPVLVSLDDFKILRAVGKGAFGKVRIVEHKRTKQLFALKYINKRKLIAKNGTRGILRERNFLECFQEYPFLVNLQYAFQDEENLFMVLDLMDGGDLRYHLRRSRGRFSEALLCFWAAELVLGIEYMHRRGVIHRDIKPENVLLDRNGHLHLTDFNVTTFAPPEGKSLKSRSGTLYYMAPEILERKGYREWADWWSLGVVLYEAMFGRRPFRGKTRSDIELAIRKGSLDIPVGHRFSEACISFLRGLLSVAVRHRLGCGKRGFETILGHPFFSAIDWPALERGECGKPPDFTLNVDDEYYFELGLEVEEQFELGPGERLTDRAYRKKSRMYAQGTLPSSGKPKRTEERFLDQFFLSYRNPMLTSSVTLQSDDPGPEDGAHPVSFLPRSSGRSSGSVGRRLSEPRPLVISVFEMTASDVIDKETHPYFSKEERHHRILAKESGGSPSGKQQRSTTDASETPSNFDDDLTTSQERSLSLLANLKDE